MAAPAGRLLHVLGAAGRKTSGADGRSLAQSSGERRLRRNRRTDRHGARIKRPNTAATQDLLATHRDSIMGFAQRGVDSRR